MRSWEQATKCNIGVSRAVVHNRRKYTVKYPQRPCPNPAQGVTQSGPAVLPIHGTAQLHHSLQLLLPFWLQANSSKSRNGKLRVCLCCLRALALFDQYRNLSVCTPLIGERRAKQVGTSPCTHCDLAGLRSSRSLGALPACMLWTRSVVVTMHGIRARAAMPLRLQCLPLVPTTPRAAVPAAPLPVISEACTPCHQSDTSASIHRLCCTPVQAAAHQFQAGAVLCCHGAAPWFPGEAWGAGQALRRPGQGQQQPGEGSGGHRRAGEWGRAAAVGC